MVQVPNIYGVDMVKILSKKDIKKLSYKKPAFTSPVVRISIVDSNPHDHVIIKSKHCRDILCLEFEDIDEVIFHNGATFGSCNLFTPKQAEQVVCFLEDYKDFEVIINCDAGYSRSAAVGMMACEIKGLDHSWIRFPEYKPNMYVYELLQIERKKYLEG
jgi:predicted protein tyrosine phosphatase